MKLLHSHGRHEKKGRSLYPVSWNSDGACQRGGTVAAPLGTSRESRHGREDEVSDIVGLVNLLFLVWESCAERDLGHCDLWLESHDHHLCSVTILLGCDRC
ncbi:hypothetical protein KC19_5G020200 [Ceratodon purpureus]|uniref:Uncharacterized protein n=1 Tax=Ceratodon purpureus TaxID=3225 RepID=A0A8T0HXZ1_CERPU|nr:hypothetical protein KC19_5G020200 [Ceratodon purpureus]